ncbi:hypothetical protein [Acutalibacter sp. 1XD8-36]|uniref:hypothetical protein n=1 Tax=Acutalibacter sp. 1XD8-36 TaxID=2320852 RepID=UPI0026395217|nr:hypothetical protein [Acutalibacter sp. 1XD8-36]
MRTEKQRELVESLLEPLDPSARDVYMELISHLSGMGYSPKKQRAAIVFTSKEHNKQLVKIGRDKKGELYFALRFSACKGYSERFGEIVKKVLGGENYKAPGCMENGEDFCKGPIEQRLYTYELPDGNKRYYCGAKALAIPGISREDIPEIERLMEEEHRFLMKYEAAGKDL